MPIELTVRVWPPQAASQLLRALAGPGGLSCIGDAVQRDDELHLTCDERTFSATLLRATVDAALHAHPGATAQITLNSPLNDELLTRISAQGLNAPELDADRLLEVQMKKAGFDD